MFHSLLLWPYCQKRGNSTLIRKPISIELPITIIHPASFLQDLPLICTTEISTANHFNLEDIRSVGNASVPPSVQPEDEIFSSFATLSERPAYHDETFDTRSATLQTRKPLNTLRTHTTPRKPIISGPSPAALKALELKIPAPSTAAPSVIGRGARKFNRATSDDDLEGTPRMNLDQEIDKLYACVQMD